MIKNKLNNNTKHVSLMYIINYFIYDFRSYFYIFFCENHKCYTYVHCLDKFT